MFTSAFPIISTPDLGRALEFYRELLGGVVVYQFPSDGPPAYVSLRIGTSEIGLGEDPGVAGGPAGGRFALWVYASDCDAAVASLRAAGVVIVAEPQDQPWGERVARVADPDGNLVIIGAAGRVPVDEHTDL
jgi:lactoylglutathione lyase